MACNLFAAANFVLWLPKEAVLFRATSSHNTPVPF